MIKVFTTDKSGSIAGELLTDKIKNWLDTFNGDVEIVNVHTNASESGFMITIQYLPK